MGEQHKQDLGCLNWDQHLDSLVQVSLQGRHCADVGDFSGSGMARGPQSLMQPFGSQGKTMLLEAPTLLVHTGMLLLLRGEHGKLPDVPGNT